MNELSEQRVADKGFEIFSGKERNGHFVKASKGFSRNLFTNYTKTAPIHPVVLASCT